MDRGHARSVRGAVTRSPNYKWWAFSAIAVGTYITVLDHASTIVALPSIAEHFHTDLPTAQWVLVVYGGTIAALLLAMGRLSDMIGRKGAYVSGFVVFVIGAALAGLLISTLGWRWVYLIAVPGGILAIIFALVVLEAGRPSQDSRQERFDWVGAALSTGLLATFLMAITSGPRTGWGSASILAALVLLVVLLATFVWWELRNPAPLLDLRLFKRKLVSLGVSSMYICFLGGSSARFLMPFYLQMVLGYSPDRVGLILVPSAICFIAMGPIGGRLSDRYGRRMFSVGGLALSAAGLLLLSRVTETSPLGLAMAGLMLQVSGMSMFNSPNNISILSAVDQSRYGVVSGLVNLVRNSGNVTGVAVSVAIVTATMASMGYPPSLEAVSESGGEGVLHAFTSGLRRAYLVMGCLVLGGMVLAFLKGGEQRETTSRAVPDPRVESSSPD